MKRSNILTEDVKEISELLGKSVQKFDGKTVIITGGAGFIGTYIVEILNYLNDHVLDKPCRIKSIDNYITSLSGSKRKLKNIVNVEYIKKDVKSPFTLKGGVDFIIHAAGIASPVYYKKYPLETIDVAVTGTRNMLELARKKKVESFLFFSSSEIYGDPEPESIPTKESYNGNASSIGPRSCYDESKRMGETLCKTYFELYKVPIKIVRPFNVFGPGMNYKDYRVIPTFIYSGINKKDILIHSNGKQTRTFCYITDAIRAILMVLLSNKNGEVYNVGNDKNEISMNKLAILINNLFENKTKIRAINYPKHYPQDEPQRRCPDLTKIKKELAYAPKVDIKVGLSKMTNWCKENWS